MSETISRNGQQRVHHRSEHSSEEGSPQPVANSGAEFQHSIMPRRRSATDVSVPRPISYGPGITGGVDLDKMEFAPLCTQIAKEDPLLGQHLRHLQNDVIQPQYQRAQAVREEADRQLDFLRTRSELLDSRVDTFVKELRAQSESALAPYVEKMEAAQAALDKANKAASDATSLVGGCHDPTDPTEQAIVRVEPIAYEVAAAKLKLPFGPTAGGIPLDPRVSWIGTALCGSVMGVSVALAGGLLHAHDVFSKPKPTGLMLASLAGVLGLAVFQRTSVRLAAFTHSEQLYLEHRRQYGWLAKLIVLTVLVASMVISVDKEGLLKSAQTRMLFNASAETTSAIVLWLLAGILIFGYLWYWFEEGALKGRKDPINNRLRTFVEEDFRDRNESRRGDPLVQDALRSLSCFYSARLSLEAATKQVTAVQTSFDESIAKAEALRIEWPLSWTTEMQHRVEDALEQLAGLHVEMNAMISDHFVRHYNALSESKSGGERK